MRAREPDPSLERLRQVMSGQSSVAPVEETIDTSNSSIEHFDAEDETTSLGEPIWAHPGWIPGASLGAQVRAMFASRMPAHLPRIHWNPGRSVVLAIGLIGTAAVAVSLGYFVRGQSHRVVTATPEAVRPVVSLPPLPTVAAASSAAEVVVDVEGKVAHPGVQRLAAGARVHDALAAAGGPLPGADTTSLDLARLLVDGEQVRVDLPGTVDNPATAGVQSGAAGNPPGPVNLNTATLAALDALPGVGPVTAQHILDWRAKHGRFTSVGQLQEIGGIGPATYQRLAPLVTV